MLSSLRKSKGTCTRGPWSNVELQTTYRADYQPFPHSLQGFLPNPPRRSKVATPALTQAPDIDQDKWARYRRYCYRTSNSVYGSSTFGQKGQSLIASVLEKDEDLHASSDQCVLPCLEKPTTCAPPPQGGNASPTSSSTSVDPKPPSKRFSSTNPSCALLTTPTHPCMSLSPAPGPGRPRCHKETWAEVTGVKETMLVAKETMGNAARFPHIGDGRGVVLQKGNGQKDGACEDVLRDPRLSTKLERVRSLVSNSRLSCQGVPCGNVATYKCSFKAQDEALKLREAQRLDGKTTHCSRSPWVSEYMDQYCSTRRPCPPTAAPQASAPPPASSMPAVPKPPQKHRAACTEYQASYSKALCCRTALTTCREYRLDR